MLLPFFIVINARQYDFAAVVHEHRRIVAVLDLRYRPVGRLFPFSLNNESRQCGMLLGQEDYIGDATPGRQFL